MGKLSPSEKSVVFLRSLLLDTDFLSAVCLLIVTPFSMLAPSSNPILRYMGNLGLLVIFE